jgi:hypothetical protein
MKIKKSLPINIGGLLESYSDDFSVHLISKSDSYYVTTIESDTLAGLNRFPIPSDISEDFKGCVDNDCIYLPTKLGQILAIDKFSGKLIHTLNTALPIMSDLKCDGDKVYCICGVPISRKWNLYIDNYCVVIFDSKSGTKVSQTSYFRGFPSHLIVSESSLYVAHGSTFISFSKNGEMKRSINMGVPIDFCPMVCPIEKICFTNKDGTVRFINEDLAFLSILKGDENKYGCLFMNHQLAWITESGIYHCEPEAKKSQRIEVNRKLQFPAFFTGSNVWASDFQGGVVRINVESKEIRSLKLGQDPILSLIKAEEHTFVATQHNLFLIEENELHIT